MTERERLSGGGAQRSRVRRVADALLRAYGRPDLPRSEPPLDALIRTVLSQHTSDVNCDRAFASLRRHFRTWESVERAPVRDIAAAIRSAGLSQTKAPRIRGILREIRARHGRLTLVSLRRMDDAAATEALRTLSGVGPKTAACVLLFSLGRDVFPVDTHVHRICRRLGFVPDSASAERAQALMAPRIPPGRALEFHINLIRHGRRVCRAQRPNCGDCVLADSCPSEFRKRAFPGRRGLA
jgi:endonuclease-3